MLPSLSSLLGEKHMVITESKKLLTTIHKKIRRGKTEDLTEEEMRQIFLDYKRLLDVEEAAKDYATLFEMVDLDSLSPFDESMDRHEFVDDWCEKYEDLEYLLYPEKERILYD